MLGMAETILTLIAIVAVLAVAGLAFALWVVVLAGRLGFALLMLPFKLLAVFQPHVLRTTSSGMRIVERPLRMPTARVVHVGHACQNPLCRKPNAQHASYCSRCGAALSDASDAAMPGIVLPVFA
jgi:hypothetical protein